MISDFDKSSFFQMIKMQKELLDRITKTPAFHEQIAKACEYVAQSYKPFIDSQIKMAESLNINIDYLQNIRLPESYLSQFSKILEDLSIALKSIQLPDFEALSKRIAELPAETKAALLLLGENGWFLDLDMTLSQLHEIEIELMAKNIVDVNSFLIDYYETRLDSIEENICSLYPSRATILGKAFWAHRNHDYELSIPVFLAQSDGISKEKINYYIFIKDQGRPQAAKYVETLAVEDFQRALLAPLTEIMPIMKSEKDRGPTFVELNRHMVLHGESLNYATQLFGCKAISLINYIGNVLK